MKLITIYRKAEISLIVDFLFKQMKNFTFPLKVSDLLKFFRKYYKIKLVKFSEFATISGKTISETEKKFCTKDARIIYIPEFNTYFIYYNDTMPNNRCRWNIIHELAHLYLNHAVIKLTAEMNYDELSTEEYTEMEEEANYFTSCCLTPYAVIVGLSCYYKMIRFKGFYTISRTFFGLSKEASYYTSKKLTTLRNFNLNMQSFQPYENYLKYIITTYPQDIFSSRSLLKYQKEIPGIRHIISQKKLNETFNAHYWEFYSVGDVVEIMLKKEYIKWNQYELM